MAVHVIDPITDPRWRELISGHASASVFHTPGWLEALRRTYGYRPVVYTASGAGAALSDGIPFCVVDSRLTGKRLVSLPFSDHCQPLVDAPEAFEEIAAALAADARKNGWKYVELRPLAIGYPQALQDGNFGSSSAFYFSKIDLQPDLEELLGNCHKTAIVQMLRRSEREELTWEAGASDKLLECFYSLLLMTRRKHQVPPQPRSWFRNVLDCLGENAEILVAYKDTVPVASIITARFARTHYYKYGCSDPRYSNLGGTPFLLWNAIKRAKEQGAVEFDMGRSDTANAGLVTFKDRWGSMRSDISYFRFPRSEAKADEEDGWKMRIAKRTFSLLPDRMFSAVGNTLYRHMG